MGGAVASGLPSSCMDQLKPIVEVTHESVFQRALVEEPRADVEPIRMTLKRGTQAIRFRSRVYLPQKSKWLADHMARLEVAGMIYGNTKAVYGSVAMASSKGANSFSPVPSYRAVNAMIEQAAMPMPNLESLVRSFAGTRTFCMLNVLRGYLQMLLSPEAQLLCILMVSGG